MQCKWSGQSLFTYAGAIIGVLAAATIHVAAEDCPWREYEWTRTVGGEQGDYLLGGVTVDNNNNVLISGYFEGKADFDPGAGKDNRRPLGDGDAYVTWYGSDGEYKGAYTFGARSGADSRFDVAFGLDRRPSGGFALGGFFVGKTDFDPTVGRDTRKSKGVEDAFVVTFGENYTYDWTWTAGGTAFETISAVAVSHDESIFAAGYFDGKLILGRGATRREFVSNGWSDVFVVRLSPTGQLLWAKSFGGPERDIPYGITMDAAGNVVIAGGFRNTVDFDPNGSHVVRTSSGEEDVFVLKMTSEGSFDWLKTFGNMGQDNPLTVVVGSDNGLYIGGAFSGRVDFNPDGDGDVHDSAPGDYHAFVTRFDPDGSYVWTRTFGGSTDTYVKGLATSGDRLILTGGYFGIVDLDPSDGVDERFAFGARSNYVCYWTLDGVYRLGDVFGGIGFDRTMGVVANRDGSVYVAGDFDSPVADFDPTTGLSTRSSQGGTDIFVTKFGCGICEYVHRHDLEYEDGLLHSTVYTLAPGGKLTWRLSSTEGDIKRSKRISTDGVAGTRFEWLPSGEYECSIRRVLDLDSNELCVGEIAPRRIVIP